MLHEDELYGDIEAEHARIVRTPPSPPKYVSNSAATNGDAGEATRQRQRQERTRINAKNKSAYNNGRVPVLGSLMTGMNDKAVRYFVIRTHRLCVRVCVGGCGCVRGCSCMTSPTDRTFFVWQFLRKTGNFIVMIPFFHSQSDIRSPKSRGNSSSTIGSSREYGSAFFPRTEEEQKQGDQDLELDELSRTMDLLAVDMERHERHLLQQHQEDVATSQVKKTP